jgi:hypothetical protein
MSVTANASVSEIWRCSARSNNSSTGTRLIHIHPRTPIQARASPLPTTTSGHITTTTFATFIIIITNRPMVRTVLLPYRLFIQVTVDTVHPCRLHEA